MSFLIRYVATDATGEVVHDETVVGDVSALSALTKTVYVLNQPLDLRVEFDPPLAPLSYDGEDVSPLSETAA